MLENETIKKKQNKIILIKGTIKTTICKYNQNTGKGKVEKM